MSCTFICFIWAWDVYRNAQVYQFEMAVDIEHKVPRVNVSVCNFLLMQIRYSKAHLSYEMLGSGGKMWTLLWSEVEIVKEGS